MINLCWNCVLSYLVNRMKWFIVIIVILFAIFWYTSKDRSMNAMIDSIMRDFESKTPNPLTAQEAFRSRDHAWKQHEGTYGYRYYERSSEWPYWWPRWLTWY
jgi:hypothetical protein